MSDTPSATRSPLATLLRDPIAVVLAVITVISIAMIYRTRVRVDYRANVVRTEAPRIEAVDRLDAERVRIAWRPMAGAVGYRIDVFSPTLETIATREAQSPIELAVPAASDAFVTVEALDADGAPIATSACRPIRGAAR